MSPDQDVCSDCGHPDPIERGEDTDGRPVGLCEACSAAADNPPPASLTGPAAAAASWGYRVTTPVAGS